MTLSIVPGLIGSSRYKGAEKRRIFMASGKYQREGLGHKSLRNMIAFVQPPQNKVFSVTVEYPCGSTLAQFHPLEMSNVDEKIAIRLLIIIVSGSSANLRFSCLELLAVWHWNR